MTACRHLLRRRWITAMAIVVAALLARMAIPTGYMPAVENGHRVFTLCAEQNPGMIGMSAMPDMPHMKSLHPKAGGSGGSTMPDHDKTGSCGFGGLSLASLPAIDPILLALALLFVVASAFRLQQTARVPTPPFLWPPRTGPPASA